MELSNYFRSVIEQDRSAVVICNLDHDIIYMNPVALSKYGKYGGGQLVGKSLLACHNARSVEQIKRVTAWFQESKDHNIVYTFHNEKENKDVYMVALRDADGHLIGYYEKHEYRDAEKDTFYHF